MEWQAVEGARDLGFLGDFIDESSGSSVLVFLQDSHGSLHLARGGRGSLQCFARG